MCFLLAVDELLGCAAVGAIRDRRVVEADFRDHALVRRVNDRAVERLGSRPRSVPLRLGGGRRRYEERARRLVVVDPAAEIGVDLLAGDRGDRHRVRDVGLCVPVGGTGQVDPVGREAWDGDVFQVAVLVGLHAKQRDLVVRTAVGTPAIRALARTDLVKIRHTELDTKSVAAMILQLDPAHIATAMRFLEMPGRLPRANDRADPRRRTHAVGMYTHVLDQHGIVYNQPIVLNEQPGRGGD